MYLMPAPSSGSSWYRVLKFQCLARWGRCEIFFSTSVLSQIPITQIISLSKVMAIRNDWFNESSKTRLYSIEVTKPCSVLLIKFLGFIYLFLIRPLHITQK